LVEGDDSTAAGVTVGMVGARRERVRIPAEVEGLSLDEEVKRAVSYLVAAGPVQEVRDALLVDGSHWLFVGATGIDDQIFRVKPQVLQPV
jgi:hypothetical protein